MLRSCARSSVLKLSVKSSKQGQNCGFDPLRKLSIKSSSAHCVSEPVLKVRWNFGGSSYKLGGTDRAGVEQFWPCLHIPSDWCNSSPVYRFHQRRRRCRDDREDCTTLRDGIKCGFLRVGCTSLWRFLGYDVLHLCLALCSLGSTQSLLQLILSNPPSSPNSIMSIMFCSWLNLWWLDLYYFLRWFDVGCYTHRVVDGVPCTMIRLGFSHHSKYVCHNQL